MEIYCNECKYVGGEANTRCFHSSVLSSDRNSSVSRHVSTWSHVRCEDKNKDGSCDLYKVTNNPFRRGIMALTKLIGV